MHNSLRSVHPITGGGKHNSTKHKSKLKISTTETQNQFRILRDAFIIRVCDFYYGDWRIQLKFNRAINATLIILSLTATIFSSPNIACLY